MKLGFVQILKIDSLFPLLIFCLLSIIWFTSSHIEVNDSRKTKIVFKEIKAERKITDITERSLKYIDGKNAFHSENYIWDLASILYNGIDFNEVQNTGGKYCTIFGNMDNIFEKFDPFLLASYLTNEELGAQVKWHDSLHIIDLSSYMKYHSTLLPEVQAKLVAHREFTIEKQFEKVNELFRFYKKAHENGSWILIHAELH